MPDIQEAKCFKFAVQMLPPPPTYEPLVGGQKKLRFAHIERIEGEG